MLDAALTLAFQAEAATTSPEDSKIRARMGPLGSSKEGGSCELLRLFC
jgi:hypothetical protein